jgi:hypothetical protein
MGARNGTSAALVDEVYRIYRIDDRAPMLRCFPRMWCSASRATRNGYHSPGSGTVMPA